MPRVPVVKVGVLAALIGGCSSAGERHEWSILQVAEYENRVVNPDARILVNMSDGYCLVGVRSGDGSTRVWVLMNPKYPPTRKRVPDVDAAISEVEFEGLPAECRSNKSVAETLVR